MPKSPRAPKKKTKAKKRQVAKPDALPTTWRTLDRMTGEFHDVAIAKMENSHLLAAIAYCERKASDYQHITKMSPVETAKSLWPGYAALVVEAARRFGPPATPSAIPAGRVIILPDEQKEDA